MGQFIDQSQDFMKQAFWHRRLSQLKGGDPADMVASITQRNWAKVS